MEVKETNRKLNVVKKRERERLTRGSRTICAAKRGYNVSMFY